MSEIGPDLEQLAAAALRLGLRHFSKGRRHPFILYDDETGQTLEVVTEGQGETHDPWLLEGARRFVTSELPGARRYAITYDGHITLNGSTLDAAFVEAGERGAPDGFVLAQPYRARKPPILPQKKKRSPFEKMGPPLLVAKTEQLLT